MVILEKSLEKSSKAKGNSFCHLQKFQMWNLSIKTRSRSSLWYTLKGLLMHLGYRYQVSTSTGYWYMGSCLSIWLLWENSTLAYKIQKMRMHWPYCIPWQKSGIPCICHGYAAAAATATEISCVHSTPCSSHPDFFRFRSQDSYTKV